MTTDPSLQLTRKITIGVLVAQVSVFLVLFMASLDKVPAYLGFVPGQQGGLWAWLLAAVTAVVYVRSAASLPPVRDYMFRLDSLKLIAVMAALGAGVVEEVIFRRLLMDFLDSRQASPTMQVLASGLAFGLAHVVWAFKSWKAGVNAVFSTSLLGAALAVVYLLADRSLAPCVVAHFLISALIEPGLMLAAVQDKIGIWRGR